MTPPDKQPAAETLSARKEAAIKRWNSRVAPIAPVVDEQKTEQEVSFEYCPACAGELDTGYECLKCGRDWRPWATFAPDSIRDEGYGWCVWRFMDGMWQTDCGDEFTLDDGTPKENDMAYCCFCGGVLGEVDNEHQPLA